MRRLFSRFLVILGMFYGAAVLSDEPPTNAPTSADADADADADSVVELFAAIDAEQISVKFIPKDSRQATLLIENRSERPLRLRLPEAMAGVPILAQFDFFGQQQQGAGRGGGPQNGAQGLGVGNQNGQNQGFFNVAPGQVGKLRVPCVCLDHGRPDPSPRMPYRLQPIESYVSRPEVIEVVKRLSQPGMNHDAVQAAAWHLNNGKTWRELAAMTNGHRRVLGPQPRLFATNDLRLAQRLAKGAKSAVETQSQTAGSPATRAAAR